MRAILRNTNGATAIEYGLIGALIAVAVIAAFNNLTQNTSDTFNAVAGQVV